MLYSAFIMPVSKVREKKSCQMNVRLTATEMAALDEIVEIEDRDRAYVVGFFMRWGIDQYRRIGSLVELRKMNLPLQSRSIKAISEGAASRLQLREEAHVQEGDGRSSSSTTKKR